MLQWLQCGCREVDWGKGALSKEFVVVRSVVTERDDSVGVHGADESERWVGALAASAKCVRGGCKASGTAGFQPGWTRMNTEKSENPCLSVGIRG